MTPVREQEAQLQLYLVDHRAVCRDGFCGLHPHALQAFLRQIVQASAASSTNEIGDIVGPWPHRASSRMASRPNASVRSVLALHIVSAKITIGHTAKPRESGRRKL